MCVSAGSSFAYICSVTVLTFFFILGARRDSMFSTIIKVELSEPNKILEWQSALRLHHLKRFVVLKNVTSHRRQPLLLRRRSTATKAAESCARMWNYWRSSKMFLASATGELPPQINNSRSGEWRDAFRSGRISNQRTHSCFIQYFLCVFLLYYSLLRVSAGTTSRSFRSTTTCRSSSDWKRELTEPIGREDIIMQEENPVTEYLIN
jgi:hypothetical protein